MSVPTPHQESGDLNAASHLTRRELEIVRLVAEGLSSREVARRLCRSPRTVENHLRAVYQKLGVRNRVELVRIATDQSLLGSDFVATASTSAADLRLKGRTLDMINELDSRMARADNSNYFAELAIGLTKVLGVRWAGMTEPQSKPDMLAAICVAENGVLGEQVECRASNSPCGAILREETVVVAEKLLERFPGWELGEVLGAEAYIGFRLSDHFGRAIGTLWIMHDEPLTSTAEIELILRLFGRRTAVELTLAQIVDDTWHGADASGGEAASASTPV